MRDIESWLECFNELIKLGIGEKKLSIYLSKFLIMVVDSFEFNRSMKSVHDVIEDVDSSSSESDLMEIKPLFSVFFIYHPRLSCICK